MSLTFHPVPHGFIVFDGPLKIAAVDTCQHVTDAKDCKTPEDATNFAKGVVIWKPMEQKDWTIHLCTPQVSFNQLTELIAGIPKVK